MSESTQLSLEKQCLVQQYKKNRLAAKDIIFPDRFSDQKLLQLLDVPREDSGTQNGDNERDFVGSFFLQNSQAPQVLREDPLQNEKENGKILSSTVEGHSGNTKGTKQKGYIEGFYLHKSHEDVKNSFKKRVRKREELQERSGQPIFSHGHQIKPVGNAWISNLVASDTPTKARIDREKMRDVPHAMWAKNHQDYLLFSTAHREDSLERLQARREYNREMELYCGFPHCH